MTTTRNMKYRVPEALVCYLCGWSEPEKRLSAINYLAAMQLNALPEVRFERGFPEEQLCAMAHHLDTMGELPKYIQSVGVAKKEYEGECVAKLKQKP